MAGEKPFFYRLNAADFFAIVREIPNKDCAKWLRIFACDLVAGNTQNEYTQTLINEAKKFKESKSLAGKKGMESRYQNPNSVITELQQKGNTDITSSSSSSSTVTVTKEKDFKSKNPLSGSGEPNTEIRGTDYQGILGEMNSILNTNFRNSDTFKKLIRARVNEGFEIQDFAEVCRKKQAEWGSDLKMMQYLRPSTLFGNKMNDYLGANGAGRPVGERERVNYAAGQAFLNEGDIWSNLTE